MPSPRIHLRVYAELVDLVDAAELQVPFGRPRSVKDLVESLGVPHVEIGLLLVDGRPVGFDHLLTGGERVAVFPPFHDLVPEPDRRLWPEPVEPRRFVLDVHLGTLTRRLRMLGFDCWYRTEADDDLLADVAVAQERILLSRDRKLLMRRRIVHGYCPRADDPDEQLGEVVRRYQLGERQTPLTRCIPCNGELRPATPEEVADEVPERTRLVFDTFARCDSCGRVYWPGSHARALDALLRQPRRAPRTR